MVDIGSVNLYAGRHSDSVVACRKDDVESDWLDWVAEWEGRKCRGVEDDHSVRLYDKLVFLSRSGYMVAYGRYHHAVFGRREQLGGSSDIQQYRM